MEHSNDIECASRVSINDHIRPDHPEEKSRIFNVGALMPHAGHLRQLRDVRLDPSHDSVGDVNTLRRDVFPDVEEVAPRLALKTIALTPTSPAVGHYAGESP